MGNLNDFLKRNNLKQVDVARFLRLSKPYISQICSGKSKLSPKKLNELVNNDRGWDTSMLLDPSTVIQNIDNGSNNNTQVAGMAEAELAKLKQKIELLEKLLEEKERTIQILMNK